MKILSLDLSTKSSGYAVSQDQTLESYGCITATSRDVIQRIIKMRNQLSQIIKDNNVKKILMEEVRPDYNIHTSKVLMWLQAAVVIAAHELDPAIQYEFINTNEWRAALNIKQGRGIRRQQLKPQDIKYVQDKYHITVNDDIADAICILDAYHTKINNQINWQ